MYIDNKKPLMAEKYLERMPQDQLDEMLLYLRVLSINKWVVNKPDRDGGQEVCPVQEEGHSGTVAARDNRRERSGHNPVGIEPDARVTREYYKTL